MKYIITDKGEVKTGGMFHVDMGVQCKGRVIAAGHCDRLPDGTFKVWGESIGYNIESKPEDALTLSLAFLDR